MKKFLLLVAVVLFSSSSLFGTTFNAATELDGTPAKESRSPET